MTNFFCFIYSSIVGDNNVLQKLRFYSIFRHVIKRIAFYVLWLEYSLPHKEHIQKLKLASLHNEVIVSLTSFPARINNLWIVIENMLRQTYRPDKIILWLSKEQFRDENDLPQKLIDLQRVGLEIRFVDGDIKSHKKYYYVFKEYSDSLIFLIDDDIIYPTNIIEESLRAYKNADSNAVIANYGNEMTFDKDDVLLPYIKWRPMYEASSSRYLFFGSGGGTLICPSMLYKDSTNINLALKLTPLADDVWLNAMVRLGGGHILFLKNRRILTLPSKNNKNLYEENVFNNRNDVQINAVNDYYLKQLGHKVFNK